MMPAPLRILLPVDGSANSDRAVELLISLYGRLGPLEVRVLHVLIRPLLSGEEATEWNSANGGNGGLRSAEALLDVADIPYTSEVRRGYVPQEIVSYAKELNCNAVIMGTRGMGTSEQILGSIVRQVVALTTLPVTLVK